MKITINDSRKIGGIQKEFTEAFPFLKLEFFAKPHKKGGGSPKKMMNIDAKTLGECRTVHKKGHISIIAAMTVSELEQQFQDRYGLTVQVYRQSGKSWLETSETEGWTLEKQNFEGESITKSALLNSSSSPTS